ncbi:MAG: chemotaxis protein CheW [Pseudomonadota bacterium]
MQATDHHGIFGVADRMVGVPLEHLGEVCVVSKVSPMMDPNPGLLGVIGLRNMLVPLLDVPHSLGLPPRTEAPAKAAILRYGGRIAAMAVDEIVALAKAAPRDVSHANTPSATDPAMIRSGFLHGTDMVSCLDVGALFGRPDIVTTTAEQPAKARDGAARISKLLIVSCGGASLAIDAIRIHATVPRRAVNTSELSSSFCLGFIEHQGWKTPVVDAATALGLGTPDTRTNAPIVVLRMAEDQLLGLAVDTMEQIALIPATDIAQSSAVIRAGGVLMSAFVDANGRQTHIVDMDALSQMPELDELSKLAMRKSSPSAPPRATREHHTVRMEAQKYLLFRAGRTLSVPTSQIARILPAPDRLVPTGTAAHAMVEGLFEVDKRSVPLVRLGGTGPGHKACEFVLLVGPPGQQIGVAVERIFGVLNSAWRAHETSQHGDEDLVELKEGADRRVVPVADLGGLAGMLTGAAA